MRITVTNAEAELTTKLTAKACLALTDTKEHANWNESITPFLTPQKHGPDWV